MSTIRFTLIAVGLFVVAFVGISWANKGFPVMAMRSEPAKPVAQITQTPAPVVEDKSVPAKTVDPVTTFEEYGKKAARKEWENSKTGQGDGDPKREALRLATLQAANAFALSLCDATMKKNLVEALTAYAKAWSEMAGCRFGFCSATPAGSIRRQRASRRHPIFACEKPCAAPSKRAASAARISLARSGSRC